MSEETLKIFKEEIISCLKLLPLKTTENDLKKKYREETGRSINQRVTEIGALMLYDILRFKFSDICDVYRFDNEIKIDRKFDVDHEEEKRKRHHHKNTAPKLNVPKVGIMQHSNFQRLNPQGFNKAKSKGNDKNLINTYKRPNYVKLDDEPEDFDNEYAPALSLSLADFVPLDSKSPEICPWNENQASAADVLKHHPMQSPFSYSVENFRNDLPNVKNTYDFPSLPVKKETNEGHAFDCENTSEATCQAKQWNEIAKRSIYMTPPPRRSTSVPPRMFKREAPKPNRVLNKLQAPSANKSQIFSYRAADMNLVASIVSFDDPVFLSNFPDVIQDPTRRLLKPRLRTTEQRITLPIFITNYFNPLRFYYHYCEISLCRLMREMQTFYRVEAKRALMISKAQIRGGLLCAVCKDNVWMRGVICDEVSQDGLVKVLLSDFFQPLEVSVRDIRFLLEKFAREPVMCVRGALAGIKPINNDTFTQEAIVKFASLACGRPIQSTLIAYNADDNSYLLEMSEKLRSQLTIGEELVSASMAQPIFVPQTYPYAILF